MVRHYHFTTAAFAFLFSVEFILPRNGVHAFVPLEVRQKWANTDYDITDALKTIEESAEKQEEEDYELYYATRYIDRIAHKLYNATQKEELWDMAKGSWELRLAYQDSRKDLNFYPYPDFREYAMAYIMIDDEYFGKGIAANPDFSFVAMAGPCKAITSKRQLYMDYQDFYINGRVIPDWDLSYFMRGFARNWFATEKKRPPLAFTIIAVTDKVLVVRGSKTGGMAVFRKIDKDMRETSYGQANWLMDDTRDWWKAYREPKQQRPNKDESSAGNTRRRGRSPVSSALKGFLSGWGK